MSREETEPGARKIAEAIANAPTLPPTSEELIPLGQWPGDTESFCMRRSYCDLGNSERLRARFGADLLNVRYHGWHAWDGRRWDRAGGEDRVQIRAQETAKLIRREAAAWREQSPERAEAHAKHAARSGASGAISAMIAQARPHLTVGLDDMDRRPDLLACANGTVELGPRPRLRAPSRDDRLTKLSPVRYDESAEYPLFKEFLFQILPNPEVREFVQRFFGYCTTGYVHEQVLVIFHGLGANGKSTLVDTLRWVLGDNGLILPFSSLLADDRRRGGEPTPDLARLPGARLVTASEPELGRAFSEAVIKTLTGEGRITARHLREEFFEFTPQFKLVLSCNNKPNVRGNDEGTWRRVLLVPFEQTIPKDERDKHLVDKLRAEASGILNWLVQGAALYLTHGLQVPESIRAATGEYRDESDPMGEFLRTCLLPAPGNMLGAAHLYEAYVAWCDGSMVRPLSQTRFGRKMGDRGYRKEKISTWYYADLDITAEAQATLDAWRAAKLSRPSLTVPEHSPAESI